MHKYLFLIVLASFLMGVISCGYNDFKDSPHRTQADGLNPIEGVKSDTPTDECDSSLRPIIFCHGYLENGDAFSGQTMRFVQNGYCPDRVVAYDWNTFEDYELALADLDLAIDQLLQKTGASKVDLIGHSMGGGLAYRYIKNPIKALKIAHYASIASVSGQTIPNKVPAISITSEGDWIVGAHEIQEAKNVILEDADHLQVLTGEQTFTALYSFFNNGQAPISSKIQPEETILLSGRALVIGTNTPVWGGLIDVFKVDSNTGRRLSIEPEATFRSDEYGYWGTFEAQAGAYYEFACNDFGSHWPTIHYYPEPFAASTDKLYFRMIPPHYTPLGALVNFAPFSDRYALFAWLDLNQAVISGRDTLSVNGIDLSSAAMADRSINTIAMFFFDTNFNGQSDLQPGGGFYDRISFMRVFDLIVDTDKEIPIVFEFNGRQIAIPNWKSKSEGVSIALFN